MEDSLEVTSLVLKSMAIILWLGLFLILGLEAPKYYFGKPSLNWLGVVISIGTWVFLYAISSLLLGVVAG